MSRRLLLLGSLGALLAACGSSDERIPPPLLARDLGCTDLATQPAADLTVPEVPDGGPVDGGLLPRSDGTIGPEGPDGCDAPCPPPDAATDATVAPGDGRVTDTEAPLADAAGWPDASGDAGRLDPDGGATPDSGSPAAPETIWFVHISDTHLGASQVASDSLTAMLEQVVPVVQPLATLHTGDLVDLGGEAAQWVAYRAALDGRVPDYPEYVEIPGNHDVKQDGTPSYLRDSQTGRAGGGMYGQTLLESPAGLVRIIRTNTADTSFNPTNVLGYFGQDQLLDLLVLPDPPLPPALTIVLGHHPLNGIEPLILLDSGTRMRQVLERFQAQIYLCGHVHLPYLSWVEQTFSIQNGSLGKAGLGSYSFALLAAEGGRVAGKIIPWTPEDDSVIEWPLVLITAPANLELGQDNPQALPIPPASPLEVHALVFAPGQTEFAQVRLDEGPWEPLEPRPAPVWGGIIAAPATIGRHTLEVRTVTTQGSGSDTIRFEVAN